MVSTFHSLFTSPVNSNRHWGVIVLVALVFIFAPQFDYNDWERNTDGLRDGLDVYDNPNAVYPPWGLILLWPYYILTSPGSRVASVLVVGWLTARCGWSLSRFFTIVLSPFFIWTMLLSNIDLLALLFPVVLWEATSNTRWRPVGSGSALIILLIKPQGSFLLIAYWLWARRVRWREMILPLVLVMLITIPISLVGRPPLLLQWLDNVQHPSEDNQKFWEINNVSLTNEIGLILAMITIAGVLISLYAWRRARNSVWTVNQTYSALLLASMLLSPYASNQSVIVPFALVPSTPAFLLQYVVIFTGSALKVYRDFDSWWTLFLIGSALWLYRSTRSLRTDHNGTISLEQNTPVAEGSAALLHH